MKMKYVDISVSVLFVLALIVIYFFWGCEIDVYAAIIAGIVLVITGLVTYIQYKKMKELTENQGKTE